MKRTPQQHITNIAILLTLGVGLGAGIYWVVKHLLPAVNAALD